MLTIRQWLKELDLEEYVEVFEAEKNVKENQMGKETRPEITGDRVKVLAANAEVDEIIARGLEMLPNTSPFDVTGHPSMSIPCGMEDGRPIGLMLTSKHFDEATVYQAAHAFEQAADWTSM